MHSEDVGDIVLDISKSYCTSWTLKHLLTLHLMMPTLALTMSLIHIINKFLTFK